MRNWWCQCTSPAPRWSPVAVSDSQSTAGRVKNAQRRWGQPGHRGSKRRWQAAVASGGGKRGGKRRQQKQTPTVTRRFCSNGSSMIRSARRSQQWRVLEMFSKPWSAAAIFDHA